MKYGIGRPGIVVMVILILVGCRAVGASAGPVAPRLDFHDLAGIDYTRFDTPPVLVDSVAAAYPEMAFLARAEGTVVIEVAVSAEGAAVQVQVASGVHPLLDRESMKAAFDSHYRPARRNGTAVPGIATVSYVFDWKHALKGRYPEPDPTPFPWTGPMVSEAADNVSTDSAGHVTYWRHGVAIHGEISVAVLDTLLARVALEAQPGETPYEVWTVAARQPEEPWEYPRNGDIRVDTCRRRRADGLCNFGGSYIFFRRGNRFVLEKRGDYFND